MKEIKSQHEKKSGLKIRLYAIEMKAQQISGISTDCRLEWSQGSGIVGESGRGSEVYCLTEASAILDGMSGRTMPKDLIFSFCQAY